MGVERDVTAGQSPRGCRRTPTTGEYEKIETQLSDNRLVVERLGGVLGRELEDGLSAWKRNMRRPGWEELLERVQSGKSNGIVVWHTDRLFGCACGALVG